MGATDRKRRINGIENFWNQAKRHLRKYNGIPRKNLYYLLKECERRLNGGSHKDLHRQLLDGPGARGCLSGASLFGSAVLIGGETPSLSAS